MFVILELCTYRFITKCPYIHRVPKVIRFQQIYIHFKNEDIRVE